MTMNEEQPAEIMDEIDMQSGEYKEEPNGLL